MSSCDVTCLMRPSESSYARRFMPDGRRRLLCVQSLRVQRARPELMDLTLPGIDGWEGAMRLKASPRTRDCSRRVTSEGRKV